MESIQGLVSFREGGQLVPRRLDELRPHRSYERHRFTVSPSRLSALAETGNALQEPLIITRGRTIIDGYGRWELARRQGRVDLMCMEYDLSDEEALQWLLQKHRRVDGLNAFCRILLALDLEPWLQERARSHQSAGGIAKGSSKLTEAEKLDVRSEIAVAAGVSVGNVTKVKQLTAAACAEVLDALRNGEVSIHRAWLWREMPPEDQSRTLMLHRGQKGVKKVIRQLVTKHKSKCHVEVGGLKLPSIARSLSQLPIHDLGSVVVATVNVPGKGIFVTEELLQLLPAQEELLISCDTESH